MSRVSTLIDTFTDLVALTPGLGGGPVGKRQGQYQAECEVDGTRYPAWLCVQGIYPVPDSGYVLSTSGQRWGGDWCFLTPPRTVAQSDGGGLTFYVVQQGYQFDWIQKTFGWHKVTLLFDPEGGLRGDRSAIQAWSGGSAVALVPQLPDVPGAGDGAELAVDVYNAIAGVIDWILDKLLDEDTNALSIALPGLTTVFTLRAFEALHLARAGQPASAWAAAMASFASALQGWDHGHGWDAEHGYAHTYSQGGSDIRFWLPVGFVGPFGWMVLVKCDHRWSTTDGHVSFAFGGAWGGRPSWCTVGYDLNRLDAATGALACRAEGAKDAYTVAVDQLKVLASGNDDEAAFVTDLCDHRLQQLVDFAVGLWPRSPV